MSRFPDAFQIVIGHEGGLSLNPADRGNWTSGVVGQGELRGTKYGVAAHAYPTLDIANLTLDDARLIYRENYWDRIGADDLPPPLALVAFDTAINSGVSRARQFLAQTRDWRTFLDVRLAFLQSLPTWQTFGRGWTNRLSRLREQAAGWEEPTGDTMNLINEAALAAIRGELTLPKNPGMCLMATRLIVERALGWRDMALYTHLVTERVQDNKTTSWWAADAEKSIRSRRLQIDATKYSPRPGDLVFNHTSPPYGHVGVVVEHLGSVYVLENAQVKRGLDLGGALNLCPLHLWGPITTIGRLPQAEVPQAPRPARVMLQRGPTPEDVTGRRIEIPNATGVTVNATGETAWVAVNEGPRIPAAPLKGV